MKLAVALWCGWAMSGLAQTPTIRTVSGEAPILSPNALAFDRAGNLYIGSWFGPIQRLTTDGALETFTGYPPGPSFWVGMAVDSQGRIYTADMTGNRVSRFDGKWSDVPGAEGLNRPHAVALDGAGNLYIADLGNRRIRVVRPDGTAANLAEGVAAVALAVDETGNVYFAETVGGIRKVSVDGSMSTLASGDDAVVPMSVAIGRGGAVYYGDFYRVRSIAPDGVRTIAGSVSPGFAGDAGPAADALFFAPQALAVDAKGDVYVADIVNGRVRKIEFHD